MAGREWNSSVATGTYIWSMRGGAGVAEESTLTGDLINIDDLMQSSIATPLPDVEVKLANDQSTSSHPKLYDSFW